MQIQDIQRQNSHWKSKVLEPGTIPTKRKLFSTISGQLSMRYVLSIQGLRRTGKSVLMRQLVDELAAKEEISPSHILFFSFDLEDGQDLRPSSELKELLNIYFLQILKTHPQKISSRVIIALDEIQNVANWQGIVKSYFDLNDKIKFLVTGSSSLFLSKSSESLAGRIIEHTLPCLDFEEFCMLNGNNLSPPFCRSLDNAFNTTPFLLTADFAEAFNAFMLSGGFPDTALMLKQGASIQDTQAFIRNSIITKILKKDLKKYFAVKDTNADGRLFNICANESGGFVELNKLAQETGLSAATVRTHLDIFAQSGLLYDLKKFDKKLRRELKSSRKYYVASPSLMYSMLYKTSTEDSAFLGHAAETYAFNKLKTYSEVIYVEKGREDKEEVDFYLPHENILIESKFANRLDKKEFSYLQHRTKALNANSLILTKQHWSENGLTCLPLFLL